MARNAYRYAVYRRGELSWSRQCLAAVVCSDEDREYLERHGCRNTITVPNGVRLPAETSPSSVRRFSLRQSLRVVFLGNVAYAPNADAIAFFADDVLPELKKRVPRVTFDVIGPGASPDFVARYGSRVNFRGFVADLDAAFTEYDVLAAPIRYGSGTKLKVLDAMAHRIPLVTSAVGAEGLSLRPGEHALIAGNAAEFVDSIVRIHQDSDLAFRLVAAAQALVRDRFSWEAIVDNLVDWLGRLEVAPLDGARSSISEY
jgi:glycosyltransferase involved in cell wall biosynthesis